MFSKARSGQFTKIKLVQTFWRHVISRLLYQCRVVSRRLAQALVACYLTVAASAGYATTLGADFTNLNGSSSGASNTTGWAFTLSESRAVSGLGVFDVGTPGDVTGAQVGLWLDGGALLASVTIGSGARTVTSGLSASSPTPGDWVFENVSLTLGPGSYVIGATGAALPFDATVTYDSGLTFDGLRRDTSGTFTRPDLSASGTVGANIEFAMAPVPLPAGAVLLVSGLLGLGLARRRRASA